MTSAEPALLRLYHQAKREQWNSAALAWDEVDLSTVPAEQRQQLAWFVAQIYRGELASLSCAGRLVGQLSDVPARLVVSTQVMDEARHVEWFAALHRKLGEQGIPEEAMLEFASIIENSHTIEETFVSLQILEVVAHTLFHELARRLLAAPSGSSLALLGTWMRDLLARDEARHLAFGQLYLTTLLQRHPERTVQADHKLEELCGFLLARAVPYFRGEFSGMGFDGEAMLRQGAHDLRERFRRAGLRAQVPALP